MYFCLLQDPDLVNAPLPVLKSLHSMERDAADLRSRYPDDLNQSGKCSSNSLEELLRPLETSYKRQSSSPYANSNKHPDPLQQAQQQKYSPIGGAIPKSRKSWTPMDAKEEESSLLLDEQPDVPGVKRTSAEFSDSADSGKSSIDSRKCIAPMLVDMDQKTSSSDLHTTNCQEECSGCDISPCDGRPEPDGCGSPSACSKKTVSCHSPSASNNLVYENLPPLSTQPSSHPSIRDPGYSRRQWMPDQNISSRHPADIRRWEQGDSGIEVDLRSASKPR